MFHPLLRFRYSHKQKNLANRKFKNTDIFNWEKCEKHELKSKWYNIVFWRSWISDGSAQEKNVIAKYFTGSHAFYALLNSYRFILDTGL